MSAVQIHVRLTGGKQMIKALRGSEDKIVAGLRRALRRSALLIWEEASRRAPVDTGSLRADLRIRENSRRLEAAVGSSKRYAIFVHGGTRPHWPPLSAIEPWARRHGVDPFLVARAIALKGTRAQPFLRQAVESSKEKIRTKIFPDELKRALNDIIES